jgi:hypothetical protein
MTNYHQISHNASDIKTALNQLVTPDTQPSQSNNAVTSGAIKSYVDVSTSTASLNLQGINDAQNVPLSSTRGFHYFVMPTGVNELEDIRQNTTGYPMFVAAGILGEYECEVFELYSKPIGSSSSVEFHDWNQPGATMDGRVVHDRYFMNYLTGSGHDVGSGGYVSGIIPHNHEYYINVDSASSIYSNLFHYEFLLQ